MTLRYKLSKVISLLLIFVGLYQIFYSTSQLVFVYPEIKINNNQTGQLIQQALLQKAIVDTLIIVVAGIYGYLLLFKPEEKIKTYHVVAGFIISLFSLFFVTRTPLTANPISEFF